MLPVRNAEASIGGWIASVEQFADAVVALDDGSTDETANRLLEYPLVREVLRNPVRDSYAGWDDAGNRQKLVDAVDVVAPTPQSRVWIVQLDADERISSDDATALRAFLLRDADPACAYLLRCYRMIDDEFHFDRRENWAGRVFAYQRGTRLPTNALHFVPLPVAISSAQYRRTTIRIQHFGNATEKLRAARFDKYTEADPDRQHQKSYDHLLDPPSKPRPWLGRAPHLPLLLHGRPPGRGDQNLPTTVEFLVWIDGKMNFLNEMERSKSEYVGFVNSPFRANDSIVEAFSRAAPNAAMVHISGPTWKVPGQRLLRLLERSIDVGPGDHPEWVRGRPPVCHVFRRDVLDFVLREEPWLTTLSEVTDSMWARGFGVSEAANVKFEVDGKSPKSEAGLRDRARERGAAHGRRLLEDRDESGAAGELTKSFGLRAGARSLRCLLRTIDFGLSPGLKLKTVTTRLALLPVLAAVVALEQRSGHAEIVRNATLGHRVRSPAVTK